MKFTKFELSLLVDAFKVYTQAATQQLPPESITTLSNHLGNLLSKITSNQSGNTEVVNTKPNGISDEWFDNVCRNCPKYSDGICTDGVTAKYPGKCDPILHFEAKKLK